MEQPNDIGTKEDLVLYRIAAAKEALESAEILLKAESYKAANNRAYYAIFYAINAVHALAGVAYKRHKDAIANFNKDYIKTEIFPKRIGRQIAEAEEIRHASDYDDFYIATRSEAQEQLILAKELIQLVEQYCSDKIKKTNSD